MEIKKLLIVGSFLILSFSMRAQFTSCEGTGSGSAVSAYAGWACLAPAAGCPVFTLMDQGSSDVVGAGGMGTSVEICLDSPIPKCGGSNDFLIIGNNIDGQAYAVWDNSTAVGTCVYVPAEDGEAIVQTLDNCAGDFTFSWSTVDHSDPYTNPCDGLPVVSGGANDCVNSTPVCASGTFGGLTNGSGIPELYSGNNGCIEGMENNAAWYSFEAATSGTITIEADPAKGNDDYDFAIWDNWDCPPSGPPIRCSWYLGKGGTGLLSGETGTSEDETGGGSTNGYTQELNVVAGEQYMLLIDGYASATDPTFDLNIGGTATLNCDLLPVQYIDIEAKREGEHVYVNWSTSDEKNNSYFEIQRSENGEKFEKVGTIPSKSNGNETKYYSYLDYGFNPFSDATYYRIKQVDYDGKTTFSKATKLENITSYKSYKMIYSDNKIDINFFNELSSPFNLMVYSSNGQMMINENYKIERGIFNSTYDLNKLTPGIYFVRMNINGAVYNEKIIVN